MVRGHTSFLCNNTNKELKGEESWQNTDKAYRARLIRRTKEIIMQISTTLITMHIEQTKITMPINVTLTTESIVRAELLVAKTISKGKVSYGLEVPKWHLKFISGDVFEVPTWNFKFKPMCI